MHGRFPYFVYGVTGGTPNGKSPVLRSLRKGQRGAVREGWQRKARAGPRLFAWRRQPRGDSGEAQSVKEGRCPGGETEEAPVSRALLIFRIVHGGDAEGIVPSCGAQPSMAIGIAVAERGGTGHTKAFINAFNGRFFLLAELRDPLVGHAVGAVDHVHGQLLAPVGRDEFPNQLVILGDFKDAPVGALGDQGVAVGRRCIPLMKGL